MRCCRIAIQIVSFCCETTKKNGTSEHSELMLECFKISILYLAYRGMFLSMMIVMMMMSILLKHKKKIKTKNIKKD